MSRSVRLETRSRARDELRRAMKAIDKVKKWEKKWVPVGGSTCKLKVYKWVPKATTEEKKVEEGKEESKEVKTEPGAVPATPVTEQAKPEQTPEAKANFPTSQFLQTTNEDSRDSFTASTAELMKYCPDPDSQDSITESDYTVTMSDQLEDSTTKPLSESSTPAPNDTSKSATPDPKITVSDAFKDKEEPTAPSIPEKEAETSEKKEETAKEEPKPESQEEEEKMETEESSTQNPDAESKDQNNEVKASEEPKTEENPKDEPKKEEKNEEEAQPNKKLKES